MNTVRLLGVTALVAAMACAQTPKVEARSEIIYEENAPAAVDGGQVAQVGAPPGTPPASADGPKPPALRLPPGVRPIKYEAELTLVPTADAFEGTIEIDLDLEAAQQLLWVNATDLTLSAADVVFGGKATPARVVASNEDFLGLQLDAPVGPGRAKLRAKYTGKISPREVQGIFRQQDGNDWFLFTHFEPFHAREAFPCFDEPNFKVPWELTLNVRQTDLAASNGAIETETLIANGMKKVKFKRVTMPSYLVAFAVGPFEAVNTAPLGAGKRVGRILIPKGKADQAQYAAKVTAELLSQLESYFGMAYPFEKLDTVAVPLFGGAMENPGLITFSQGLLLAKPEEDSTQRQRQMASVQAHELAHMWFGDFVTMKWWDDTWLKEAFSDWMASKVVNTWKPEWKTEVSQVGSLNSAMSADSLVAARAIRPTIQTKGDIVNAFDFGIAYLKGDAVLSMLEGWVGPEQYRAGIRDYLKANAWKNAEASDFFAAISKAAGKDVTPVFSSFIDQPGVPLVTARLECKGGPRVLLTQKRYLPLGSKGTTQGETWKLPVCVRYGVGKDAVRECTLLEGAKGELKLTQVQGCPDWIYPNENQAGYYRSSMPPEQVKALLAADVLVAQEEVGLLGDLRALVLSGDMQASDVLQLIPRLVNNESRHVVGAAVQAVAAMKEDLVPEAQRANYQRFVAKTFGARARQLGITPKKKEEDDQRLLRPTLIGLVADEGNDAKLQAEAKKLAERWLVDHSAITPDMVGVVLNVAGRNADAALYEKVLAAAKASKDRRERQQLINTLGAVRDPALVQRNLDLLKASTFDVRESGVLLWGALEDTTTRELAYSFLKANWDTLTAQVPKQYHTYYPSLASAFCDKKHRDDAEAFFKPRMAQVPGGDRSLLKALERVDLCIAVKDKQMPSVSAFLRSY